MIEEIDIAWFAGLMEGEGSFIIREGKYPLMSMSLTDLDVLERVQKLIGGTIYKKTVRQEHYKPIYQWRLRQPTAYVVGLMKRLKHYMGNRRVKKIDECIACGISVLRERASKAIAIKKIRDRVRELSSNSNYTHQQIANETGCDRSHVSRILSKTSTRSD